MSRAVLYMSMSLDGYIAGPDDRPGNGLGTGGERLHGWLYDGEHEVRVGEGLPTFRTSEPSRVILDEMLATGAVLTGRRTFEAAGGWGGDHHHGVPIEVLTRRRPGADAVRAPNVHYATDGIAAAMARAQQAAGNRDVFVHGATTAQLALQAGVLDDLEIQLVPLLLGAGRSLFGALDPPRPLELVRVLEAPSITHLRYRVAR